MEKVICGQCGTEFNLVDPRGGKCPNCGKFVATLIAWRYADEDAKKADMKADMKVKREE